MVRAAAARLIASDDLDDAIRVLEERFGVAAFDAAVKRRGKTRKTQRGRKKEYDDKRLVISWLWIEFIRRLNLPARTSIEEACSQLIAMEVLKDDKSVKTYKRRYHEADKVVLRIFSEEKMDFIRRIMVKMVHIAGGPAVPDDETLWLDAFLARLADDVESGEPS